MNEYSDKAVINMPMNYHWILRMRFLICKTKSSILKIELPTLCEKEPFHMLVLDEVIWNYVLTKH